MTEITRWRGPGPARRIHLPLPEPPRHRHVSKAAREPKDLRGRALEEWLRDLAVARTHDGD
ncbi:MAG TPA: hypothetical protein VFM06_02115 [Candidatus Limnocylindria bacterium]|nr:hypothetical protein [Candidatus Limnocylindria bacterium]